MPSSSRHSAVLAFIVTVLKPRWAMYPPIHATKCPAPTMATTTPRAVAAWGNHRVNRVVARGL